MRKWSLTPGYLSTSILYSPFHWTVMISGGPFVYWCYWRPLCGKLGVKRDIHHGKKATRFRHFHCMGLIKVILFYLIPSHIHSHTHTHIQMCSCIISHLGALKNDYFTSWKLYCLPPLVLQHSLSICQLWWMHDSVNQRTNYRNQYPFVKVL